MSLVMIPLDRLHPNSANVRENLGDLTQLAASIKAQGLLQPLVVTEGRAGNATVVDGHRRLAAAKLAGIPALPCLLSRTVGRNQVATMLAAAMHKQLEPLEQANAFAALRNQGLTIADIARRTGYSTATISGRLLILNLPREAQDMVAAKELSLADATQLTRQVKAKGSGRARSGSLNYWLTTAHRLAQAAGGACTHRDTRHFLGAVACGQCWEATIRADERGEVAAREPVVDQVAVQRAIDGDQPRRLTPNELAVAVEQLVGQGLSHGKIAERLRVTDRTVRRHRQRRDIPVAIPRSGEQVVA